MREPFPSHMGMASGIAISAGMIMGGVGVSLHGLLADRYGLLSSMEWLVVVALLAGVAGLALPGRCGSAGDRGSRPGRL